MASGGRLPDVWFAIEIMPARGKNTIRQRIVSVAASWIAATGLPAGALAEQVPPSPERIKEIQTRLFDPPKACRLDLPHRTSSYPGQLGSARADLPRRANRRSAILRTSRWGQGSPAPASLPHDGPARAQLGHARAQFVTSAFTITPRRGSCLYCCVELSDGCVSPPWGVGGTCCIRADVKRVAGIRRQFSADVDGPYRAAAGG